jgi:hypothetical protein
MLGVTRRGVLAFLALMLVSVTASSLEWWFGDCTANIALQAAGKLNPYREFNEFINSFVFSEQQTAAVMGWGGEDGGYYLLCYLRDLIAGTFIYWGTAGTWHLFVYGIYGKTLFEDKNRPYPEPSLIRDQQLLAQGSLFLYAALPILSEYLIEEGYTKVVLTTALLLYCPCSTIPLPLYYYCYGYLLCQACRIEPVVPYPCTAALLVLTLST